MQDYNFWADLLFTFQSSPDWIRALWLLVPPGFVLAVMAMVMRFGLALRWRKHGGGGGGSCSVSK